MTLVNYKKNETMKESLYILLTAVVAGIAISVGGFVYLKTGAALEGAVLFTFGLLTVVHYRLHLFTGKAGFFDSWTSFWQLFSLTLLGNFAGCWLSGLFAGFTTEQVQAAAQTLLTSRLQAPLSVNFLLAIPCGFIMTTAVEFGRSGKFLPLLFGVPVFIMCGFRHSIADAFYYCAADQWTMQVLLLWISIVAGNFIGCNLYRVIVPSGIRPV